jgi:hypothetical protein
LIFLGEGSPEDPPDRGNAGRELDAGGGRGSGMGHRFGGGCGSRLGSGLRGYDTSGGHKNSCEKGTFHLNRQLHCLQAVFLDGSLSGDG